MGADVIELPMIEIKDLPDYSELDLYLKSVKKFNWMVFTSTNSVDSVFNRLDEMGEDSRCLANIKILAIGDVTCEKLLNRGIKADLVTSKSASEEVIKELSEIKWKDTRVLIPASNIARTVIRDGLATLGAEVVQIPAYTNTVPENVAKQATNILNEGVDVITFASSSTVDNLIDILGDQKKLIDNSFNVSIGATTTKTAENRGIKISAQAERPDIESMVQSLLDHYVK